MSLEDSPTLYTLVGDGPSVVASGGAARER
jgi:hypothetical protein